MSIGTKVVLGFDGRAVQQGLAGLSRSFSGMAMGGIGGIVKPFAQLGALLAPTALIGGMAMFGKSSSEAASSIESLTTQFTTLLGSQEAAVGRMKEIAKFAADTPYEISELASTSKMLQTLGGDLLATGAGLTLVGDAAAMAGQPLSEIGLHIGRIFNAITSGTSAGESINRLQEVGLITGTVKLQFEKLAESQKKNKNAVLSSTQALQMLQSVMPKVAGGMAALAATTEGKISNMKDNISQLKVAFGTGMNDGLRVALDAVNLFLPQFLEKFKSIGDYFGQAIGDSVAGNFEKFIAIGDLISSTILVGIKSAFEYGMPELAKGIAKLLEDINPIRRGLEAIGVDAKRGSQWETTNSLRDLIEANAINSGLGGKLDSLRQGNQGFVPGSGNRYRYAGEGEKSIFSDAAGNKVIEVLQRIENNTKTGSKM